VEGPRKLKLCLSWMHRLAIDDTSEHASPLFFFDEFLAQVFSVTMPRYITINSASVHPSSQLLTSMDCDFVLLVFCVH
jgi:hypothetical protein